MTLPSAFPDMRSISPVRLRFIGGFGKIYWIETDDLKLTNIFSSLDELKIVEHMNKDHANNLKDYVCFYLGIECSEGDALRMMGLDQFGVDLSVNNVKYRIDFKAPLQSPDESSNLRELFETQNHPVPRYLAYTCFK